MLWPNDAFKTLMLNLVTNVIVLRGEVLRYGTAISLHKIQEVNESYMFRKQKLRKFTSTVS